MGFSYNYVTFYVDLFYHVTLIVSISTLYKYYVLHIKGHIYHVSLMLYTYIAVFLLFTTLIVYNFHFGLFYIKNTILYSKIIKYRVQFIILRISAYVQLVQDAIIPTIAQSFTLIRNLLRSAG